MPKNTYKQVFKAQRKLLENAPSEARNYAGILFIETVVPKTPVDTGRARANWRTDIGTPLQQSREDIYDPTATKTPSRIRQEIKRLPKAGKLIISNWLRYISALEHGHSRQAPAGFLQQAAAVVARYAPTFLLKALKGRSTTISPINP